MTWWRAGTCAACGRRLTNDPTAANAAAWTGEPGWRIPYCADSRECQHDAETIAADGGSCPI
jgi:hypothetical protein